MRKTFAAFGLVALTALTQAACAKQTENNWLVGVWAQTVDEDGKPFDDTVEFLPDGTSIHYGPTCEPLFKTSYHVYDDKVYVTAKAKKGFVTLLFVPSSDHKQLVFTSIRTGNNAVYVRSPAGSSCVPAKQ